MYVKLPTYMYVTLKLGILYNLQAVMDHTDATSQTEWWQPCSAAVQYSARSMSDEEAHSVWQGSAMKEFLGHVCPR